MSVAYSPLYLVCVRGRCCVLTLEIQRPAHLFLMSALQDVQPTMKLSKIHHSQAYCVYSVLYLLAQGTVLLQY